MTKEQEKISCKNRIKARHLLGIYGRKDLALHHIDPSWKENDIERYIQWNLEDLVIMNFAEHSRLHQKLNNSCNPTKQKATLKKTISKMSVEDRQKKFGHKPISNEQQEKAQNALRNKIKDVIEKINKAGYKTRQQLYNEGVSRNTFYKEYELVYKIGQVGAYKHI